jgi:hypothetical protein
MGLADEFDYPLRGPDALKIALIGGGLLFAAVLINLVGTLLSIIVIGLLILPFAFVPQLLTQGYLVRVLDSTLDGGAEPPAWAEWTDIFVDGLKLLVVVIVYFLPLVVLSVVFAVLFAGLSATAGGGGDPGGALAGVGAAVGLLFGLLVVVLSIAALYLAPIGLCGMAHDGDFGGAFDLSRLRAVGTSREYAVAWLVGGAILVVGGGVAQLLVFLLVGFPLVFVVQVLAFRIFARGYADALGLDVASAGADASGVASPAPAADPDPLSGQQTDPDGPGPADPDPLTGDASEGEDGTADGSTPDDDGDTRRD